MALFVPANSSLVFSPTVLSLNISSARVVAAALNPTWVFARAMSPRWKPPPIVASNGAMAVTLSHETHRLHASECDGNRRRKSRFKLQATSSPNVGAGLIRHFTTLQSTRRRFDRADAHVRQRRRAPRCEARVPRASHRAAKERRRG